MVSITIILNASYTYSLILYNSSLSFKQNHIKTQTDLDVAAPSRADILCVVMTSLPIPLAAAIRQHYFSSSHISDACLNLLSHSHHHGLHIISEVEYHIWNFHINSFHYHILYICSSSSFAFPTTDLVFSSL